MNEPELTLSTAGQQRREAILSLALDHSKKRRRRRQIRAGAYAAVALAAGVLWFTRSEPATPSLPPLARDVDPAPSAPHIESVRQPAVQIVWIETDPTLGDRLAIAPQPRWTPIGDEELLTLLADAGQPAGLVHIGGRTLLLPHRTH